MTPEDVSSAVAAAVNAAVAAGELSVEVPAQVGQSPVRVRAGGVGGLVDGADDASDGHAGLWFALRAS